LPLLRGWGRPSQTPGLRCVGRMQHHFHLLAWRQVPSSQSCSAPMLHWRYHWRRLAAQPAAARRQALACRDFARMALLHMRGCRVFVRMAFVRTEVCKVFVRTRREIGCRTRQESLSQHTVSPSPRHTLATYTQQITIGCNTDLCSHRAPSCVSV
jgi:hypothetical protein